MKMDKMDRLSYKRMNRSDNVITIDLHNGYRIMAISGWEPAKRVYVTTLFLSEVTIDNWSLMEEFEHIEFECDYSVINSKILKYVCTCFGNGSFDYYINRYQLMTACVDKFYELCEMENKLHVSES